MSGRAEDPSLPAWKPYRDGAQRTENIIDLSEVDRVYQSIWCVDHQVTDFVLVQQVKRKSRWSDVVKVDCCHQMVHAHMHAPDGSEVRKDLQAVRTTADLRIGIDKANDLIFKHWERNLRRWQRGR